MKRQFWLLLAVLTILVGCEKSQVYSSSPKDPQTPETPEPPKEPEITYTVVRSAFSTTRDDLKVGGYVYTPEELDGKKPAMIFCTGLDATYEATEPYAIEMTKRGFVSCCFDFCGGPDEESTSLSDGSKADNTISTELLDLEAVLNAVSAREDVDPDNIILLGGSQGGLVAALYAAQNPSAFKALGLLFPAFNLPDLIREGVHDKIGDVDVSTIPDFLFPITSQGHKFYKKYIVDIVTIYPFDVIGAYKGPVLLIHGALDPLVPVYVSERAVETYDDVTYHVIADQGHGFDAEGTAQAIKYFDDFLTEAGLLQD